ncbi:hypothetical protein TTHERM_00242410 (macronuclear) [Tetrahymena thermophila SB210]|uniref:Transmembrane protein n=1 Tax=Tetrahymena thermophila (strain SB210) TaxID=312017 RepID=I7MAJ6_TETTS|nr:hypothetical protein TTHERM_00242410 [Tetrahymena thermophila SB210]EAS04719.2 hypothetical protein TTHERM_00242410 [Tetrahymena thermophila SB210]|eukprot:XP_001024964.2 hypothetical protein TTHERM_00242410 [Tetrahymena thermophila SB210]
MKSIYITLALISLLAFTQAADLPCPLPSCDGDANPQQCQAAQSQLAICFETKCANLSAQDPQALLTCITTCQPTYQPLKQKYQDFFKCLSTNQQIQTLSKCVQANMLGCQNDQQTCATALQAQSQCVQSKCASSIKGFDDLDGIQKCIFSTCKSDSSLVNNAEKQIYECATGKKVSVSAKILISSVFTLIGYLILF